MNHFISQSQIPAENNRSVVLASNLRVAGNRGLLSINLHSNYSPSILRNIHNIGSAVICNIVVLAKQTKAWMLSKIKTVGWRMAFS